jgi:hypothetical protein
MYSSAQVEEGRHAFCGDLVWILMVAILVYVERPTSGGSMLSLGVLFWSWRRCFFSMWGDLPRFFLYSYLMPLFLGLLMQGGGLAWNLFFDVGILLGFFYLKLHP